MPQSWYRRAAQFLQQEFVSGYQWIRGQWVSKEEAPTEEVLIRQQIEGGKVEVAPQEEAQPAEELNYLLRKAYAVWYSWPGYETKREVAIYYWANSKESISESEVKSWLSKAISIAFTRNHHDGSIDIDTVDGWGHSEVHYTVTNALLSDVKKDLDEYTYSRVNWEYTVKDSHKDGGVIVKQDMEGFAAGLETPKFSSRKTLQQAGFKVGRRKTAAERMIPFRR